MTDYISLLSSIATLNQSHVPPQTVDPLPYFPLPRMYHGQQSAVEQLLQYKAAVLSPHTGAGKTATFRTIAGMRTAKGEGTIIIEPRKFLQKQVASYCDDFVLFGRSEYPCDYADTAATAPCTRKVPCSKIPDYDCQYRTNACGSKNKNCFLFRANREWVRYPCSDCKYLAATGHAKSIINHGGVVICNFGNFWNMLPDASLIIIDEADLFFKEISTPMHLRSVKDASVAIPDMIKMEEEYIRSEMQTCTLGQYYAMKNALYRLAFFKGIPELLFSYRKTDRRSHQDKVYIEVNPANTNLLKDHLFGDKDVIIVTATPSDFNLPIVTYSIHQRCGIYYTPVGKLTSRSIQSQPWLLTKNAPELIRFISTVFAGLYDSKKFVVHCGNIGTHANGIYSALNTGDHGEKLDLCTLHEAGNLMETIESFMRNDKRYLLVASAEYGADFSWCNCQFVLKVPYASLDDRMKALERKIGKTAFNQWYTSDAIMRLVQMCGRVGRGWDSFGVTFVMDSKFSEVYRNYKHAFPLWFRQRLVEGAF